MSGESGEQMMHGTVDRIALAIPDSETVSVALLLRHAHPPSFSQTVLMSWSSHPVSPELQEMLGLLLSSQRHSSEQSVGKIGFLPLGTHVYVHLSCGLHSRAGAAIDVVVSNSLGSMVNVCMMSNVTSSHALHFWRAGPSAPA